MDRYKWMSGGGSSRNFVRLFLFSFSFFFFLFLSSYIASWKMKFRAPAAAAATFFLMTLATTALVAMPRVASVNNRLLRANSPLGSDEEEGGTTTTPLLANHPAVVENTPRAEEDEQRGQTLQASKTPLMRAFQSQNCEEEVQRLIQQRQVGDVNAVDLVRFFSLLS